MRPNVGGRTPVCLKSSNGGMRDAFAARRLMPCDSLVQETLKLRLFYATVAFLHDCIKQSEELVDAHTLFCGDRQDGSVAQMGKVTANIALDLVHG